MWQISLQKCQLALCVAVALTVGFYKYTVTEKNAYVPWLFLGQPVLQRNLSQTARGFKGVPQQEKEVVLGLRGKPKLVLYWSPWFGTYWAAKKGSLTRFGTDLMDEMRADGCPEWRCIFTYDKRVLPLADAVLSIAEQFPRTPPLGRTPSQRWLWVDVESPQTRTIPSKYVSHLVNWTMTYHERSDVVAFYGYFRSLNVSIQPVRPNLIENHVAALARYRQALARNLTLLQVMGPAWTTFVSRPKIVAWMSGRCPTPSKREEYVRELARHIHVDMYGNCGTLKCGKRSPLEPECWLKTLRHYLFYMSMENSLCDQYITEKLYNPLVYKIVPVVWGGANYSRFLPPNSFIDARKYHPKELAALLLRLSRDPVAYSKYHLWRGFWEVRVGGSLCDLCHRLHTDTAEKHHVDLTAERLDNNRCVSVKRNLFGANSTAWREVINNNRTDSAEPLLR
ncbi:alpha-(1,3)-fucosyltransferase C-like [Penaeus japonicus]|uniref:alpha-(1,3)-fucosyltransferase C-like n=1 Tax=Penaeus japonicus TaxID=27405 RepID=UPI001C711BFA|nr:alpha-(1,3)-fucosyltransferase C-like [Penaeus japonicus]